jgi:hypothetical protein
MCKISNFSSPLEIAFGLSAVFYYLELRSIAEKRTNAALTRNDAALTASMQAFIVMIIETVSESAISIATSLAAAGLGGIFVGSTLPKVGRLIFHALKIAVLYVSLLILKSTRYFVHILVLCSVTASLGSLIYSGYYPEETLNCSKMTQVILASYLSISWNLIVYFIYIPIITRLVILTERSNGPAFPPTPVSPPPPTLP